MDRYQYAWAIHETFNGHYIVCGRSSIINEGDNIWILKLTDDGDVVWQKELSACIDKIKSIDVRGLKAISDGRTINRSIEIIKTIRMD